MLNRQVRKFGESLVERHVLAPDLLEDAMDESARTGLPLPTILLQRDLVGPKDLAAALCVALGLAFVDFEDSAVQPAAAHAVPESLARKFAAIGVEARDDSIVVAFADPADPAALGRSQCRGARADRIDAHTRRCGPPRDPRRDRERLRFDRRRR